MKSVAFSLFLALLAFYLGPTLIEGADSQCDALVAYASELASNADARDLPDTSTKPGAVLVREWDGTTHRVVVLESGYSWNGRNWSSLSVIATKIAGTRWSGPRFFGLKRKDGK